MLFNDPREHARWPLTAAEAWVATRSFKSAAESWASLTISEEARQDYRAQEAKALIKASGIAWTAFASEFAAANSTQNAEKSFIAYWCRRPHEHYMDLWPELQNGRISAWGISSSESEFSEISPVQFDVLRARGPSSIGTVFGGDVYRLVRLNAEQLQIAFPAVGTKAVKQGRPPKYDWLSFHAQCQSVWEEHGGFDEHDLEFSRPAHLNKIMAQWCVDRWGEGPSESLLKSEIGKFLKTKGP